MICSCCRHEYDETAARVAYNDCLARKGCGLLRCPNCGFESAPGTSPLLRLRRAFGIPRAKTDPGKPEGALCASDGSFVTTLAELRNGEGAIVQEFSEQRHVRKFLSLGILPGTHVTLVKDFPAVVLRVGYSEFALDRALAG